MKKELVFPNGAGGNHIRWLMYFDKSFDTMHFSADKSPDNKLSFIQEKIYPNERTWHNWAEFEWKYRKRYNHIVNIDMQHNELPDAQNKKTIVLTFNDYMECAKRALIFIYFNKHDNTLDEIKEYYKLYDSQIKSQNYSSFEKVITGDVIWDNVLDKKFYYDIIDFWGFEDHYEYAAKVHTLWKNCQTRSLNQFIETCQNDECINFVKV